MKSADPMPRIPLNAPTCDSDKLSTEHALPVRQFNVAPGRVLMKNATLNLFAEGWTFIVLIVAMPRLVRDLGETSFGLFSLAWVIIGYLLFFDLGVSRAATKFVSEFLARSEFARISKVARTAIATNLLLGTFGAMLVVISTPWMIRIFRIAPSTEGNARLVFYYVGLSIPVLLISGTFRALLTSFQRFDWINGVNSATTAVQWAAACIVAVRTGSVAAVVLSTVVIRAISTIVFGTLVARIIPDLMSWRRSSYEHPRHMLRFGSWVTVSQLVSPALVYMDRALLASFASLAAVSLYSVPFEMMNRIRILPASIVQTLYPAFSERGSAVDRRNLRDLYDDSLRYLLAILLPCIIFLVVFGKDILTVWMGEPFAARTGYVVQILAAGVLLNCIANIPYNAVQALGRPDLTGKFHMAEIVMYVGLCLALIPRLGITGAAIANSIRISIDAVLLLWAAHRFCDCSYGLKWVRISAKTLIVSGVFAAALVGVHRFAVIWTRLGAGCICILVYFLIVWWAAFNNEDRRRFYSFLQDTRSRLTTSRPLTSAVQP